MVRLRYRMLVASAVMTVLLFGAAPAAFALSPSITAVTPPDGARFTGGFTVSFSAADADGLAGAGSTVGVGSSTYRPTVTYSGYWEGDGCDSWWVEDRTSATFRCVVPDPGPGTFSVTIRVPDMTGEVSTKTLTVTRTAALTFAKQSPAPGGRYRAADDLLVAVSGSPVSPASVSVLVDGVAVPAACQTSGADVAMVSADHVFTSGAHTVTVSAGDGSSAPPATTSWSFTVSSSASPPSIGPYQPTDGSVVQGPFQLSYHIADPNTVDGASARVSVLGNVYSGSVTYPGYWESDGCDTWWAEDRTQADVVFAIPDLPPGSQALRLEVADATGDWTIKKTEVLRSAALSAFGHTPSDGSRSTSVQTVSVSLSGGTVAASSVAMTIDGSSVPAVFTPSPDGGTVRYVAPIAEGAHAVRVSASDVFGSPAMAVQWSFVVDRTAPRVASVSPSADSTMTLADAGIAVRLEDSDAIAPDSVRLRIDGVTVATALQADSAGAWVRWAGVLDEGAHQTDLVARDLTGNEVVHAWAFAVADPPRVGTVSPSSGLVSENALLTAEVSDVNAELDPTVILTVDGNTVPATFVSTGARRGRVEGTASGLANGQHNAVLSVRDVAGNQASKAWTFSVDALSPSLQSRYPLPGAVLGSHTVSVSGRFTDASSIAPATGAAWLDGAPVAIQSANEARWEGEGCDAYEVVVPETLLLGGTYALHDGPHTMRMRAVDQFGHSATEEWSFTVREYPKITSVSPVSGIHTEDSGVTLSATATDFDGVASTAVAWRRSGEGASSWQPLPSTYDPATGRLVAQFTFPSGETGYEFRFAAEDTGGLTSTATTSLYVDGAPPAIDVAALRPTSGAVLANRSVALSGRFSDSSDIDLSLTKAWIDGLPVAIGAAHEVRWVGEGCDAYEEELPGTVAFSGAVVLHDGSHTVRVQAGDVFGFQATHEWSFVVKEAPKIAELTPAASSRTTETHVVASAKVTDYDGIATAAISWREANTGRPEGEWHTAESTYDAVTGLLRADFAFPRDDTRYEFRVSATDSGGLTTTAATSVFAAASAERISAGTDCTSCHTTILQTHPMQDCLPCHGSTSGPCDCHGTGAHGTWLLTGASLEDHNGAYTGRICVDCHSHDSDVEAQRHASGLPESCAACHEQALTAEHEGVLVDGGAFTCETCHDSAEARVTAAIAARDTSCMACHPSLHGDFDAKHTSPTADCNGGGCHASSSLVDTHEPYVGQGNRYPQYDDACQLCHANEDTPRIPEDATAQCAGCHPDRVVPHGYEAATHAGALGAGEIEVFDGSHADASQGARSADVECGLCHSGDLGPVHANRCSTCHPAPRNSFTAWSRSCTQDGCHATYHENAGKVHYDVLAGNCSACHDEAAFELHSSPCAACHALPNASDSTPPVTSFDQHASYEGTARVAFDVSDGGKVAIATTFYRLDGAAAKIGESVDVSAPGAHTLEYWSVDQYGNAETPHKTTTFAVVADTTPPVTTSNAQAVYAGSATIDLAAVDTGYLGVKATHYRLDGGPTMTGTRVSIPQPPSGSALHTLQFWSEDWAGNIEIPKTVLFTVSRDVTPPVSSLGLQSYYKTSSMVQIPFAATDAGSDIQARYYKVDGGSTYSLAPGATAFSRSFTQGPHVVEYWAVDGTGNTEAHRFATTVVDWTAPSVTSNALSAYPASGGTIAITASDLPPNGSGPASVRYRLDDGAEQQSGSVVQVTVTAQGLHLLEYWAVDNAGNTSTHAVEDFVVGPSGTITFKWDSPPAGSSARYQVWDSSNRLVRSGSSGTTPDWNGWFTTTVPVDPLPYRWQVEWYDSGSGDDGTTTGSALIDHDGDAYESWY